jgi:xanthine dehydrogenase iron-sulfur cluster and FAD-binding subunit A
MFPRRSITMPAVSMTVNGKPVSGEVEGRTLLVQFLREHLSLTGTHVGCDTTQCGACAVHVDGKAVKSCTYLALMAEGCEKAWPAVMNCIRCRKPSARTMACSAVSAPLA